MGSVAAPQPRNLPDTQAPRRHGDRIRSDPRAIRAVFRDREELASATNLGTTLIAALEQSACQM
jgi:hypothetical protein